MLGIIFKIANEFMYFIDIRINLLKVESQLYAS